MSEGVKAEEGSECGGQERSEVHGTDVSGVEPLHEIQEGLWLLVRQVGVVSLRIRTIIGENVVEEAIHGHSGQDLLVNDEFVLEWSNGDGNDAITKWGNTSNRLEFLQAGFGAVGMFAELTHGEMGQPCSTTWMVSECCSRGPSYV